jgi:protein tyrosine phosphatase
MEDHLRDRYRLEAEWQSLCTDEANEERPSCSIALSETNTKKNRYIDCIPCKLNNLNYDLFIKVMIDAHFSLAICRLFIYISICILSVPLPLSHIC